MSSAIFDSGPNIEYMQVCLEWWNHHLKGQTTTVMQEPKLRVYLQDACPPATFLPERPGKWLSTDGWPRSTKVKFTLAGTMLQGVDNQGADNQGAQSPSSWQLVPFSVQCGQTHGEWLDFGSPVPPCDQRISDAHALTLTTPPLQQPLSVLGFARLQCRIRVLNHNQGNLIARLVDVTPTGESTMIAYGYLNLTHRDGHEPGKVKLLVEKQEYDVSMELHAASHVIAAGHRLRLSVSACYWPGSWPSSKRVHMEMMTGQDAAGQPVSVLSVPTVGSEYAPYTNPLFETKNAHVSTSLPSIHKTEPLHTSHNTHDLMTNVLTKIVKQDSGLQQFPTMDDMLLQHKFTETYTVTGNDPQSAVASTVHENIAEYPNTCDADDKEAGGIRIHVRTCSQMRADDRYFYYDSQLKCMLNEQEFYGNEWNEKIERLFV